MKFTRNIFALVASLFVGVASLSAQDVIDMAVSIDEDTAAFLGENNTLALRNKLSKIITRNGMADAEGFFALVPTIAITDDGVVDTGMTKMRVMYADLTLSVVNSVDGTVFDSQTVSLQGNGNSDEACVRALINKLNVNDARLSKLLKDSRSSIDAFYERQMPILLKKIETMIAAEQYDEALAAMSLIPETVEQYNEVCDKKIEVYNRILEIETLRIVADADALVRQGHIDEALELCRTANILSPNYGEVVAFLKRLDAEAAAAEAAMLEQKQREADAEKSREKVVKSAEVKAESVKADIVKAEIVKSSGSKTKKKSLGQVLFGL